MKFEKGQRVHVLLSENERRYQNDVFCEGVVTRIGSKYVYATWATRCETKFDKNGHEVTGYPGSAATLMNDDMRAGYERSVSIRERFRALGFAGMYHDLNRFSMSTIETVLTALEADEAGRQS